MKRPLCADIFEYISSGDVQGLEELVAEDSSVVSAINSHGQTPLIQIICHRELDENVRLNMAKIIMQSNDFDVDQRNVASNTALHFASMYCRSQILDLLINHGANINAKGYFRRTPLYYAIDSTSDDDNNTCLNILVRADGIDLEVPQLCSKAPQALSCTISKSMHKKTRILIKHGASVDGWQKWSAWKNIYYLYEKDERCFFAKWRSYLPQWTVFNQKYYPKEFVEICIRVLCLLKRLNNQDARVSPDMRKLLLSYIADGWRKKVDKIN